MDWMKKWKNKKVLITGHTGFKGSWMCAVLKELGANVTGYALKPPTIPALFDIASINKEINSIEGDVRDLQHLREVFERVKPEVVIHMAAQPLVRESYQNPVYTYETNVMGTVHILECVRLTESVNSFLNVTTDKVYKNREWPWGYREYEELNGQDPYSNSKSCSELITDSYLKSFLQDRNVVVSTMRAGNVIGGGDFAKDRIIPDCLRAAEKGKDIVLRNPSSIRPYQHVLEPVMGYLMLAITQMEDTKESGNYNIGPDEKDCITTGELADLFCAIWSMETNKEIAWRNYDDKGPHEAGFLKLDCSKIKSELSWQSTWGLREAVGRTIEWYLAYCAGQDMRKVMEMQIKDFMKGSKKYV